MAASDHSSRLEDILSRFQDFQDHQRASDDEEDDNQMSRDFQAILQDLCNLIRDAELSGTSDLEVISEKAHGLFKDALSFAYGEADLFDFIPSFAHTSEYPQVTDETDEKFGSLPFGLIMSFMTFFGAQANMPQIRDQLPKPWNAKMKPHPSTTPLSRFRANGPSSSANETHPLANAVYQARCEITSGDICSPTNLSLSSGYSCIALPCMGGWKNRCPILYYFLLDDDDAEFLDTRSVKVGLSNVAYHSTTYEPRKLIFVADDDRIKSYAWGSSQPGGPGVYEKARPVHTLNSGEWGGALHVLPNGMLMRPGKGSAGYWDLDQLATHGPKGTARIGKRISVEETWRDDPEDIERSSGSEVSGTINFHDSTLSPSRLHPHPSSPSSVLCTTMDLDNDDYSCLHLDLEHGGKIAVHYFGHGGTVADFSTSDADPRVFATACTDGYARLYDIRHRLPVLTMDSGKLMEPCPTAALAHPDGIPTLFTGGDRSQQIKLWDIRARKTVYELATGNNDVLQLAWDKSRAMLYAATICQYVDRHGHHFDYRAKIPKSRAKADGDNRINEAKGTDKDEEMDEDENEEGEEYDSEEDTDFDDDDEGRNWPEQAFHSEDYFGYTFDASDHRIYRYAFKANANPEIVPAYGYSSLGDPYS